MAVVPGGGASLSIKTNLVPIAAALCAGIGCTFLVLGYLANSGFRFYAGGLVLAVSLPVAVLTARAVRRLGLVVVAANTISLGVVALFALEAIHGPQGVEAESDQPAAPAYSFRDAQGNPEVFKRRWNEYTVQWYAVDQAIQDPDPSGALPYLPRPGSSARFFDSVLSMNDLGFRGGRANARRRGSTGSWRSGNRPRSARPCTPGTKPGR